MKETEQVKPKELERRTAILKAAEELFSEKGLRGVSIDEVSSRSAVSKGLVSYHFNSKEELFTTVTKALMESLLQEMAAIAQDSKSVREKVRDIAKAFLRLTASQRNLWLVAMYEAPTLGGNLRRLLTEYRRRKLVHIRSIVDQGVASGELKKVDSRLVALFLTGMISDAALGSLFGDHRSSASYLADHIAATLIDGCGAGQLSAGRDNATASGRDPSSELGMFDTVP